MINSSLIENPTTSQPVEIVSNASGVSWTKGSAKIIPKKSSSLVGLIKVKKASKAMSVAVENIPHAEVDPGTKNDANPTSNGLSLLGAYSDSENSNSDGD